MKNEVHGSNDLLTLKLYKNNMRLCRLRKYIFRNISHMVYLLRIFGREATGPDFILLKVIKFVSNVIGSHNKIPRKKASI